MTETSERKPSLREQYPEGSFFRVIKEGAKLDGMQPIRGGYQGWQVDLPVGTVLCCRGVQWGWGGDPGLEVRFTTDDLPTDVSYTTVRPAVYGAMTLRPADGYLERVS